MGLGATPRVEDGLPAADPGEGAAARRATAADDSIRIVNAKEHNLKNLSRERAARQVQRGNRRIGFGQEHAGLRHPVQ